MALTVIDYTVFTLLKERGVFPPAPSILELGESQWYGDVDFGEALQKVQRHAVSDEHRAYLKQWFHKIVMQTQAAKTDEERLLPTFEAAKLFFHALLNYSHMDAIDLHGTSFAKRLDLNKPVAFERQYDLVFNLGTGEHVFNICQFFETVHNATRPGGLMVHEQPFSGWVDHGFYNFQPTFYYDMAAANGYNVEFLGYAELTPFRMVTLEKREDIVAIAARGEVPANTLMFSVFRKPAVEKPFQVPYQGFYFGNLSAESTEGWRSLRG